ncbi:MAG: hypothetical protein RLZZ556_689, partial [Actinomycetota bacterium]
VIVIRHLLKPNFVTGNIEIWLKEEK